MEEKPLSLVVGGAVFGVLLFLQSWFHEWRARKRLDATRRAAALGAVAGAKQAIAPVAETMSRMDQSLNGHGEGPTGGTGLTARMERMEAWQADHDGKDDRNHDAVMGEIKRLTDRL